MNTQDSASSPQNASTSSMHHTTLHQSQPHLRTKVVEILSRTANGCLQELSYHPGMTQKLNELARSVEDSKNRNAKLFDDNNKLSLAVKRLSEKYALADRFHKAKIQTLEQQVEALHRQHQETLKREQKLAAAEPDYSRLHSEYIRVVTICKTLQQEVSTLQRLLLDKSTPPATPNPSSAVPGNAAPLRRNSMNIPAQQQQPQRNPNATHPNQQLRQMVNQPQPGPSQLPRRVQVPSQHYNLPPMPPNSSQLQSQSSMRVQMQNSGYMHANIQASRPSANFRPVNIPNDAMQIDNTQVPIPHGALQIQNQTNSPSSQRPTIHGWNGNTGYGSASGSGTNRQSIQVPMKNMVGSSPNHSPNQGQSSSHNPRIPGSRSATTMNPSPTTTTTNTNMNMNNTIPVPLFPPIHHISPPLVMNQHVQHIMPTLPSGSTLFAIGNSGELLSPLMGATALPSAPLPSQHQSSSSPNNSNSRTPSHSTENASTPVTRVSDVQAQTRNQQMQIENSESPTGIGEVNSNSPIPSVPPSPSVHSLLSTPTPALTPTPAPTPHEQEDKGNNIGGTGSGLKRANVDTLEDNGDEENVRKKVKLDGSNTVATSTLVSESTTATKNVLKDDVEVQAQAQAQAETKKEEKENKDEDEDDEDGDDDIGPDGLRTIKACLEAFVDDDENEVPTCQLCLARHVSGLIDKPTTFNNSTEQQMVDHFLDQHPSSWESLRYCREE